MRDGTAVGPGTLSYPKKVVIFDLDGVIVDSLAVMREAFTIAYGEVVGNGNVPFEEYKRHLGRYFPDIMRIMKLPPEIEGPFVRESYRLAGRARLFPGVTSVLHELRDRKYRMAIATGKAGDRARHLLRALDVLSYFDFVVGSDEVARAKPAPDIVLRVLGLLNARPEEAVMVGDSVTDIAAAHAADVDALAALWGECDRYELIAAEPDATLYQPSDLLMLYPEVAEVG
jgi:AHBA synthesis associated protein